MRKRIEKKIKRIKNQKSAKYLSGFAELSNLIRPE